MATGVNKNRFLAEQAELKRKEAIRDAREIKTQLSAAELIGQLKATQSQLNAGNSNKLVGADQFLARKNEVDENLKKVPVFLGAFDTLAEAEAITTRADGTELQENDTVTVKNTDNDDASILKYIAGNWEPVLTVSKELTTQQVDELLSNQVPRFVGVFGVVTALDNLDVPESSYAFVSTDDYHETGFYKKLADGTWTLSRMVLTEEAFTGSYLAEITASQTETDDGTEDEKFVSPKTLKDWFSAKGLDSGTPNTVAMFGQNGDVVDSKITQNTSSVVINDNDIFSLDSTNDSAPSIYLRDQNNNLLGKMGRSTPTSLNILKMYAPINKARITSENAGSQLLVESNVNVKFDNNNFYLTNNAQEGKTLICDNDLGLAKWEYPNGHGTVGTETFIGTAYSQKGGIHYVHIRLPPNVNDDNDMYRFEINGFTYSSCYAFKILTTGYMHKNSNQLGQNKEAIIAEVHDGTSPLSDLHSYIGKDGYLYLTFKTVQSSYCSINVKSMYVGNGRVFPYGVYMVVNSLSLFKDGYVAPISYGNRSAFISVTCTKSLSAGHDDPNEIVDGSTSYIRFADTNPGDIIFDFTSDKSIAGISINSNVECTVDVYSSSDNTTWNLEQSGVNIPLVHEVLLTNPTTAARYLKLSLTNIPTASMYIREVEFVENI